MEKEKLSQQIFVSEVGAGTSHCPDLSQIPYSLLEILAERFEVGEKKYGRDNWRKGVFGSYEQRTGSVCTLSQFERYALNRLNHIIRHSYALALQICAKGEEWITEDTPQGNIAAIAWGAAFLSESVPALANADRVPEGE